MHEEALISCLKSLYEGAGFRAYKMRKFEEYSLYLENRDFLLSDFVITFSDMSGRLLALKPDVTLSIVKGSRATKENGEKVYYIENVYRLDERTHEYREIRQMGLEALGEIDNVQTLEILLLALKTLKSIDEHSVMDIAHMGCIRHFLKGADKGAQAEILKSLQVKSARALDLALEKAQISDESKKALVKLNALSGDVEEAIDVLMSLSGDEEYLSSVTELSKIHSSLKELGMEELVRIDFSIANDLNYYTGIVFQGYVPSAHRAVLSGGRYDGLSQKFLRGVGALGFALYLSDLENTDAAPKHADALIVYKKSAKAENVIAAANELRSKGLSVRVEADGCSRERYAIVKEVE